ncbi:uncharacterized protein LOC119464115 [Dermacentor silvarum]|uniref:uncharacterized protein LOC119464115 n=1 Tax=Dermacentor silvarum TaxID=543639 RepID=UPI001898FAC1|nr:uncharacterized protein LOC119464115 [Dermacentor silvarum]XP_049511828.1 uncharacterized protein LOC119464115 [Dermacentor silvarum]
MEHAREFGDPEVLLLAEDHIILKLETAWSRDMPVPDGLSFADDDGLLLVATRRSLVSAWQRTLLREARVSKALFCACAPFDSSDLYARAASEVLRDAVDICIVHNRDKIYKIIRMFPNVRTIALLHDLTTHVLELDEPCRDRFAPLVERCQLRQLVGNDGSRCNGSLHLSRETTLALIRTCPDVHRIDSIWVMYCFMGPYGLHSSSEGQIAKGFTYLFLNSQNMSCVGIPNTATAADVAVAAKKFPSIEKLQVVVTSLDVLTKLSTFRNLRSLMVALSCGVAYADVDFELERLLKRLPGLEELDVGLCSGLRLSTIGRLCPKLKVLRIVTCVGSSEDTPVDGDAFPNLECVNISMHVLRMAFNSFLAATRFTLRTAFFDDDSMCFEFLQYCVRFGRRLPFPRLEHLTLDTKLSLRKLEIEPSWLGDLLKALPALRHLATNSYDLRLFFENNGVPRGRVSLSWIGCVYCAVHKPDNDRCS